MTKQERKAVTKQYNHFITYTGNIRDCNNTCYPISDNTSYLRPKQRTKDFEKSLANKQNKDYN